MKMKYILILFILAVFCLTACGSNDSQKATIELKTVYNGKTIDLCDPLVRAYLDAETEEEQVKTLLAKEGARYSRQNIIFSWESDGSSEYTLYVADNKAFENAYTFETIDTMFIEAGVFVPGTTYYWKVVGDTEGSTSGVDTFKTLDKPVRFITTTEIPNVRDLGGWQTEQGQKVKYGLFRQWCFLL